MRPRATPRSPRCRASVHSAGTQWPWTRRQERGGGHAELGDERSRSAARPMKFGRRVPSSAKGVLQAALRSRPRSPAMKKKNPLLKVERLPLIAALALAVGACGGKDDERPAPAEQLPVVKVELFSWWVAP